VTPPPIRSAASPKPAIAHAGNELLWIGALAETGDWRRLVECLPVPEPEPEPVVGVVVVVGALGMAVGAVLVGDVWLEIFRGACLFLGLVCWRGGGGGGVVDAAVGAVKVAAVVAVTLVVGRVTAVVAVVLGIVVSAVVVVAAAVESPGPAAAGARMPVTKPNAAIAAPRQA
jgi:hypothetical protein